MTKSLSLYIKGQEKRVKLELMTYEIEQIIDCLEREPHAIYEILNHQLIINKLKKRIK